MRKTILMTTLVLSVWAGKAEAHDYNIVAYGAKTDTTILSTKAVQQAIDDCSKAGGGRVVVPTGQYKIGSIVLKSNVHIYLEQGATLFGSTNIKDYLPMKSDYISLRTQTPTIQLIYADKKKILPLTDLAPLTDEEEPSRNSPGTMRASLVPTSSVSSKVRISPSRTSPLRTPVAGCNTIWHATA